MILYGKEVKFLRTVSATCEIADLCEDGNLENYTKLFTGPTAQAIRNKAKVIHALAEGYELHRALEDPEHKPDAITVEQILALKSDDFIKLYDEAFEALFFDEAAKATVETQPSKKDEEEAAGK